MKISKADVSEIIKNIEEGKLFELETTDGGIKIKITKYVPFCCSHPSGYAILFRCTKGHVCCWDLQSKLFVFLGFSIRYQVFSLQMYELLFNVTTFYSFI